MMTVEQLEAAWETLAEAIDRAGPDRERLFLAKLALALAQEGDPQTLSRAITAALEDLQ